MKKTIYYLCLCLLLLACSQNDDDGNTDDTFVPQQITPVLIAHHDDLDVRFEEVILTTHHIVFQEPNAWQELIDLQGFGVQDQLNNANINFDEYTVLVCADEPRPKPGYHIGFGPVMEYENEIVVQVNYWGGSAANSPSRPFIIAKIPATDKPIVFEEVTLEEE